MVDKLTHCKELCEDVMYPVILLRRKAGDLPHAVEVFSEEMTAYIAAMYDLATAINRDDPAWRGADMTGPKTEAPDNTAVKAFYQRLKRDAQGLRRYAPYNAGMTPRQMVVFGVEMDPPEDCFMTRLRNAILLDDPNWTP